MIDTADLPTTRRVRVLADAAVQIAHFVTGMEITANKTSTIAAREKLQFLEPLKQRRAAFT